MKMTRSSVRFALAPLCLFALAACSSSSSPSVTGGDDAGGSNDSGSGITPHDSGSVTPQDSGGGSVADGSSADTGATDSGAANDSGGTTPDAGPPATCGPAPARYTLLSGADAGLVRDNVTGLVWMTDSVGAGEPPQTQTDAATYCTGRGMRLPTEDEALAIAANYASCAFGQWSTWTSTAFDAQEAWVVDYLGDVSPQVSDNFPSAVLCVRGGTD